MRRRESPYSRIEAIRQSRSELIVLVLATVILGTMLSLLGSGLYDYLLVWLPRGWQQAAAFGLGLTLTAVLVAVLIWLFYTRGESQPVRIEIQLPYHLPADGQPTIAERGSYQVTVHARRAFARRYRRGSPEVAHWLAAWREARQEGVAFQHFIAEDNAALVQCLLLYVLHRYGEGSLGPEAAYGWWKVDLPAGRLAMDDLPPPVRDNPFLRADQNADEWRLWLPADVRLEVTGPRPGAGAAVWAFRWRLVHRRYGHVELRCYPRLAVAGRQSQPFRVLTQRLHLNRRSEVYVIETRLEAVARFRWTFWPASDAFHEWATGLLSHLDEALDWKHFLATRPDRLLADLDWKLGWVPHGTSVWDKLEEIEGRLEALEVASISDLTGLTGNLSGLGETTEE